MPFSIKRLTQMHRSSSLPTKNKDEKKTQQTQPQPPKNRIPSQLSASRSIDSAEIRRNLGGHVIISNPIPIDSRQFRGPQRVHHVTTVRSSGYYSDAPNNGRMNEELLINGAQRSRGVRRHQQSDEIARMPRVPRPSNNSSLFDDDPGIMSEIETSATGFRRSTKARASLPIVRTPSKTQERPLGLVFLQYRTETKRALLPNEITSIDTVKALFVRSFPRQLSMQYLEQPNIRIYIHDLARDMFYELEDLRDVRDRCVLRIYEHGPNGPAPVGGYAGPVPQLWMDSAGYFSEPEFESRDEFVRNKSGGQSQYYGTVLPAQFRNTPQQPPPERTKPFPGYAQTLPRGVNLMSYYNSPPPLVQRSVSPDLIAKKMMVPPPKPQRSRIPPQGPPPPYPQQLRPERPYSVAGQYPSYEGYLSSPERVTTPVVDQQTRMRMQMMEKHLANLTTVVHKALTPPISAGPKSEKPLPPPKPASLLNRGGGADLTQEMVSQLRHLRRKTKDLRQEIRSLRRLTQQQTLNAKDLLKEACLKISSSVAFLSASPECQMRVQRMKLTHERDSYGTDSSRLEKDLLLLESQVEELRSNVINRRCRVNMNDVETMAMVLSRSSKTVADLKVRFPHISDTLRALMTNEMDAFVKDEKFLKDEPERLETSLKRCKKLTGTLVTLKRLASVQEQRSSHDTTKGTELEPHTVIHVTPQQSVESRQETVLDALLDELQAFSKRQPKRDQRSNVPNPPPRSSSARINCPAPALATSAGGGRSAEGPRPHSTPPVKEDSVPQSSSTTSISSVGSVVEKFAHSRQELLEQRHQELLRKQRQLQEQYTRLQQLSRGQIPRGILNDLKKTGSESNIVSKMNRFESGSLTQLTGKETFETDII